MFTYIVKQRLAALLLVVATLAAGWWAWSRLPVDAFPDATGIQVMVLAEAPGLSATEVERSVSRVIEQGMMGLPDLVEVRSLSANGLSQVRVVFHEHTNIYLARQLVSSRLGDVEDRLPDGVETGLGPISTGLGEVYQYTLEAGYTCAFHLERWSTEPGTCPLDQRELHKSQLSLVDLRTLQDTVVAPRLRTVPGIAEINSFGGGVQEFHVVPDPAKMLQHQVTVDDIVAAVESANFNSGAGSGHSGEETSYITLASSFRSPKEIESTMVKKDGTATVRLGDVAAVAMGVTPRFGALTRDGRGEAVGGMVIMLKGENSREVVERVKERLDEIRRTLPAGVAIRPFYDRTSLVEASISTVSEALAWGSLFVVLILFFFLANLRAALIVAISLPITVSLVFLAMKLLGTTANLMTLGGLAIAIGMVVDATIVVVENTTLMLNETRSREGRFGAVAKAVAEVWRPIVFSVMVIIVVLLPLFTLEDIEGKMFIPMALTIVLAMAASLAVALFLIPPLTTWLGRGVTKATGTGNPGGAVDENIEQGNPDVHGEGRVLSSMKRGYAKPLGWAVRNPLPLVVLALAGMGVAGWMSTRLGTEFLPPLDEGSLAVNLVRLPSAGLDSSVRQSTLLEQMILADFPEVETVVGKTGRPEIAEDPMGPEQTDLLIQLRDRREHPSDRSSAELVVDMNRVIMELPGLRPSFSQPIALRVNELISGVKSDVAIRIFGDDLEELTRLGNELAATMSQVPGAQDVKVEMATGMPETRIIPNRDALTVYGLTPGDLKSTVTAAVGGITVGWVLQGERQVPIRVKLEDRYASPTGELANVPVSSGPTGMVRLGDVASIETVDSPAQISRDAGKRRLMVEMNVRGRDLGSFIDEAREAARTMEQSLPAGYYFQWGGQFENQQRASTRLAILVPIALVLILLAQLAALGNLRSTLLVILNLPFSVVGGIMIVYFANMTISVSVLVGLIALLGMAVQHGTLLVSYIDELRARGMTIPQAVQEGSLRRLRPLLMTKFTSILGLIPIMFTSGPGSDVQKPLAAVVLGGLVLTTLLNLFLVPSLYRWFHRGTETQASATGA